MMSKKMPMSAIILAGGKSSRMGQDKALLPYHGHTLLEEIARRAQLFFDEVLIIVDKKEKCSNLELAGAHVHEDIIKGCGPLAGLYTGFCHSQMAASLVLTCDMPFIGESIVRDLIHLWDEDSEVACFQDEKGFLHPFPGIYSKSSKGLVRILLDQEEYSMHRLFDVAIVKSKLLEKEKRKALTNVNTQEDYKNALKAFS